MRSIPVELEAPAVCVGFADMFTGIGGTRDAVRCSEQHIADI